MTSIIPAQDINALMLMSPSELNKTTAQMTALLSEMASDCWPAIKMQYD